MKNMYFESEAVSFDDLYFICYMIERVARKLKQPNSYVVNKIQKKSGTAFKLCRDLTLSQSCSSRKRLDN